MATAAEMRARLAKYKESQNGESSSPAVAPEKVCADIQASSETSGSVPSGVSEGIVVHPLREIRNDVQPATLVVVERPAGRSEELVVASGVGEQERLGNGTNLDTSNPVHQDFLQRLADLEAALLARDPLMKTHLGAIHKHMIQYEEIANLLTVEEISKIMDAQQAHTGIELRAAITNKSKASAGKKAAKLGLEDV